MCICVTRINQQHIHQVFVHIILRKCLQPILLQSTFNNIKGPPSQCRASGTGLLSLGVQVPFVKMFEANIFYSSSASFSCK